MSSNRGSSGVRGLGVENCTDSAIAGSQRYFATACGSVSADLVTAAFPPSRANWVWIRLLVNHSRNFTAPSGLGAPEAIPQMKVPMAGPCLTCIGVVAMLILPGTLELAGLSISVTAVPVYSVSAMHLPS